MKINRKRATALGAAVVAVLAFAGVAWAQGTQPAAAFRAITTRTFLKFSADAGTIIPGNTSLSIRNAADSQDNLIITNAGNATVAGDVTTGDDVIATGDVTAGDHLIAGDFLRLTAATSITVTNGGTLTPTGSYQPITAAGTSGISLGTGAAGNYACIVNASAQTITITDTGTFVGAGNAALGQNDSVCAIFDGTNWVEVSRANN
jgi:hypothetical protein